MRVTTALPLRKDVPVEHTWDVHSIFPSDQDWEAAVQSFTARLPELAAFRGRLGEGPAVLARIALKPPSGSSATPARSTCTA